MLRIAKDELLSKEGKADMDTGVRWDEGAEVQEKDRAAGWEGGKYGGICEQLVEVELQAEELVRWQDADGREEERTEEEDGMGQDFVVSLQDACSVVVNGNPHCRGGWGRCRGRAWRWQAKQTMTCYYFNSNGLRIRYQLNQA